MTRPAPDQSAVPGSAAADLPWWFSLLSRLPLPVLYVLCGAVAWFARHVLRLRLEVARRNLAICLPGLDARERRALLAANYRQFGQIIAEIIAGARMPADELRRRVPIRNIELPRALLAAGKPVLLVAAHQANWEWAMQAMALVLGHPLDVGYKPIRSRDVDRAMQAVRRRFGAHLVPAKELLPDLLRRRHVVRGIGMLADQEPRTSDHQHWTGFLGRRTAFYMGPEQIARATRYPAVFVAVRRLRRGHYEAECMPLAAAGEQLAPGEFTERYARLVEREILAAPADWTWGHRRWKPRPGDHAA